MTFFKYKADYVPVFLLCMIFVLDLVVFFYAEHLWQVVTWLIIGIAPKSVFCSFSHHHQHLETFNQPILNRLIEVPYACITGITSHLWYLHHVVGHHMNFMDQTKDESRWKRANGKTMTELEYAFSVWITSYARAVMVGKRFPKQMKTFVIMTLIQLGLLTVLFIINWQNALFVYLLPMAISLFLTAWLTYYHHAGLDTQDEFAASFNCTNRFYNLVTGNLGYHTAHHKRWRLHWSLLPKYHKSIEQKIPEHLIHQRFFSGKKLHQAAVKIQSETTA
ncbi:fatty acid desaturase [Colwelliaceae bacterium BS250]